MTEPNEDQQQPEKEYAEEVKKTPEEIMKSEKKGYLIRAGIAGAFMLWFVHDGWFSDIESFWFNRIMSFVTLGMIGYFIFRAMTVKAPPEDKS